MNKIKITDTNGSLKKFMICLSLHILLTNIYLINLIRTYT